MVMGFPLSNELDGWDEGSLKGLSFCLFSGCLDALGQPEKHGDGNADWAWLNGFSGCLS